MLYFLAIRLCFCMCEFFGIMCVCVCASMFVCECVCVCMYVCVSECVWFYPVFKDSYRLDSYLYLFSLPFQNVYSYTLAFYVELERLNNLK